MNTKFKFFLLVMLTSSVAAFSQKENKTTAGGLVTDMFGKQLKSANVKSKFLNKDITTNRFGTFSLDGITNGDTLMGSSLTWGESTLNLHADGLGDLSVPKESIQLIQRIIQVGRGQMVSHGIPPSLVWCLPPWRFQIFRQRIHFIIIQH